ncbi:MAG: OstA-like protein [Tenuifilaceae bacterium]|nr:OstA-like protein [Tenuifilaceae bacterium]
MTRKFHFVFSLVLALVGFSNLGLAQQRLKVDILNAESLESGRRNGIPIQRLIGNVRISHRGTIINCDSVHIMRDQNMFDAFSRVVITDGSTKLYGDVVYFDGTTNIAKIRGKEVKLVNEEVVLTTQFLDYNTRTESAKFFNGGHVVNKDATLTSERGYYNAPKKVYSFANDVVFEGEEFRVLTDSLEYVAPKNVAYFFGPTRIYNQENFIYCERGWYNREKDQSNFTYNAFIDNGKQRLYGQDIFYDRQIGYAKILERVAIVDSLKNTTIFGGEASYWEKTGDAEVVKNPLLVLAETGKPDSLFLRADKFIIKTLDNDRENRQPADSVYRKLKALGNVRFFRADLQGVCDSLVFDTRDSLLHMYVEPILWNMGNQLTADLIKAKMLNQQMDRMFFEGNAFAVSQEDTVHFNQIKGKNMTGIFSKGKLLRLDVLGNGQSVYYVRDEGELSIVNRSESSSIRISLKDSKVSRIVYLEKPVSNMFPVDKAPEEEITLKGFKWLNNKRPKSKMDVIPTGTDFSIAKRSKFTVETSKKK